MTEPQPSADRRPSVLLVDDVHANILALEALLGDMGCELVRANGGNEALKQLLKREFAVMLLDVQMPEMDGYEVARYARENPSTRDVPIIFLTAMHDSEASVLRGYGAGAVDFLFKPINAHVLRAKVRIFLDLYLSRQRLSLEVMAHKKTSAQLELSNTALRHFTDAASHDLRAPLRAIRSFLEVLSSEAGDKLDPQARDYLDRSRKAVRRMDSLLNALLAYARLQKPSAPAEVDVSALLEHVRADLVERITETQAEVSAGPLPIVRGDPDRLYQLFLNLISNAIKFRQPNKPPLVRITAEQVGEEWVFCVADDGIGIDPTHHQHVFDAFARLHDHTQYDGSGLGLAICQQIVEQHGGRIWVESAPLAGSRFYFSLPRGPARASVPASPG